MGKQPPQRRRRPSVRARPGAFTAPLALWLVFVFVGPLGYMFRRSFATRSFSGEGDSFSLENYRYFIDHPTFFRTLGFSMVMGLAVASTAALIGVPAACFIQRRLPPRLAGVLLTLLLFPYLTSHVVRVFAWMSILGRNGLLNTTLVRLHIVDEPLSILLYSRFAVFLTLLYVLVPLMITPVVIVLYRLDERYLEAADDLGAEPLYRFRRVTLPMIGPGIVAGFILVFASGTAAFVEPLLVGGVDGTMISKIISNFFTGAVFYERGSALAFITLLAIFAVVTLIVRLVGDPREALGLR